MKVGPYTIRVLGEGGVRDARPEEGAAIEAQLRLVGEAAEAGERLDPSELEAAEREQRERGA